MSESDSNVRTISRISCACAAPGKQAAVKFTCHDLLYRSVANIARVTYGDVGDGFAACNTSFENEVFLYISTYTKRFFFFCIVRYGVSKKYF